MLPNWRRPSEVIAQIRTRRWRILTQRRCVRSHALRRSNAPLLYGSKPLFFLADPTAAAGRSAGEAVAFEAVLIGCGAENRAGSSSSCSFLRPPNHLANHISQSTLPNQKKTQINQFSLLLREGYRALTSGELLTRKTVTTVTEGGPFCHTAATPATREARLGRALAQAEGARAANRRLHPRPAGEHARLRKAGATH